MKQKERVLMYLINTIFSKAVFPEKGIYENVNENVIKKGDLVICRTSGQHKHTIGYVHEVGYGYNSPWVIREIAGEKLCNITNDCFFKIPDEWLPYWVHFDDKQYDIYQKCIKAINKGTEYYERLKEISFSGNICTVKTRKAFSDNTVQEMSFAYNSKTTIKSIINLLSSL